MIASPAGAKSGWQPVLAVAAYAAIVLTLLSVAFGAISGLVERQQAVAAAQDMLDQLQGRKARAPGARPGLHAHAGSPFLEGPTLTVAGATLMQRVAAAVEQAEGRITSSRVELEGAAFGADFVAVTATLELAEADLQNLLYDLEAGQPFLFVGQLVAQGAGGPEASQGSLQVTLTVYGRWQGAP